MKPAGVSLDPRDLAAGRYGTDEMVDIWGPEQTFAYSLQVQGQASSVLSELHPAIVPPTHAAEIVEKASLEYIQPARIRELEAATEHDVIAINTALEEQVSPEAKTHINKLRTSADTTQSARAVQLKRSLAVIVDSLENLRDIVIEKAVAWKEIPHMDLTHFYDALPTVLGRPFAHYAEMLQSDLAFMKFVYDHSLLGKWGDATGNHHSATAMGVDGIALQEQYCTRLGLSWMTAAAQVPGLEFEADVVYSLARTAETVGNLAEYMEYGRGDDANFLVNNNPKKKKGSAAMPHKDAKNGNPIVEEQTVSITNYLRGWMTTALANCRMPYARTLFASANSRIQFEDGFKFLDHGIRRLADTLYWIAPREERCQERVLRSYGVVVAQEVMNYLTDQRKVKNPLPRSEAHDVTGRLATEAWETKTPYLELLLREEQITSRLDAATLRSIADPLQYIGESKRIIDVVVEHCYQKKTLAS